MSIEIDLKKIDDLARNKWESFRQYWKDNHRSLVRFKIGLLIGLIWWGVLNSILGITEFIITLPMGILAIILLFLVKLLGIEDEAYKFWEAFASQVGDVGESTDVFMLFAGLPNIVAYFIELINALTKALTRLGGAIFENFTIMFPVLLDIKIDINWLHVSLPYLFRTVFNIVQFIVLFYCMRKIKRRVKERIRNEIKIKSYVWFGD